jgi:molecular chaperone HscA
LWISNNGKIYLGEEAIARSLHSDQSGNRQRFDSLKRELILGMKESSPFQRSMNDLLNPTDVPLSNGDAITLYLGYLTDLACTEMEEEYHCSRYVVRNFGLPSWDPERRTWGEDLLRTMLVKAQIVADTFHGKWDNGVSIHAVKSALEKIDALEKLPDYLVTQGITEPIAVGSSRLRQDEPFRGLVMVVDIGAGTSDLALFVVVENPERNLFNAFPIKGCNQSLHMAGDTLDSAMLQAILKKAGIKSHDHDYPYVIQMLRMQVRSLKEDLFRDGYCNVNLVNGARLRIDRDEFLRQESVNRFKKRLAEKFEDVLKAMKKGLAQHFGQAGLSVVLTGGGATLPMVKELAVGAFSVHSIHIHKSEVPLVPEDFEYDTELATVYPQLAVAIGGTMPFLIDEKNAIDDIDIPQGKFTLGRTQVTGI